MKRLSSILLALLLLVSIIGVTVSRHYCNSILVKTSLIPPAADACDATMPMDDDSCNDEHQYFSVDSPLALLASNFELIPSVEWTDNKQIINLSGAFENLFTPLLFADIFPPPSEPNIYTRVQSFLL